MSELIIQDSNLNAQQIVYLVAEDTNPKLQIRFKDLDLTLFSELKAYIKYASGDRLEKTIVVDSTDSEVGEITWISTDLIIGDHEIEFSLDSNTLPKKFPVVLKIRHNLG